MWTPLGARRVSPSVQYPPRASIKGTVIVERLQRRRGLASTRKKGNGHFRNFFVRLLGLDRLSERRVILKRTRECGSGQSPIHDLLNKKKTTDIEERG